MQFKHHSSEIFCTAEIVNYLKGSISLEFRMRHLKKNFSLKGNFFFAWKPFDLIFQVIRPFVKVETRVNHKGCDVIDDVRISIHGYYNDWLYLRLKYFFSSTRVIQFVKGRYTFEIGWFEKVMVVVTQTLYFPSESSQITILRVLLDSC